MGARRRLLSIYIHLFSPLSREWASPLKKQLLVSGQPQEFPPPSAHTSGSRCCNRESQGLCVCASDLVSITEKLCWKRSVFSFLMNLNSEDVSQKCTGSWSKVSDWSKSHGRWGQHVREKGWHHSLFSGASIAPTRMSVAWTGKYWFLFTFIILLLCVCTYMTECIPHMHVYVWGQLVKLVLFFHVVTGDQPRDDQAWGQASLPTEFYCQLIYFHLNFLSLSTKRFHVDWYFYPQWAFWSHRVIKGRCPFAISCNVTKVFE